MTCPKVEPFYCHWDIPPEILLDESYYANIERVHNTSLLRIWCDVLYYKYYFIVSDSNRPVSPAQHYRERSIREDIITMTTYKYYIAAVSAIPDIEDRLSSRMRGGRNYN